MQCKNHPTVPALDKCAGCGEAFCPNCLVYVRGQKYCGTCKQRVLGVQSPPHMVEAAMIPCKEANTALIYAIVGFFCLGIILEPMAISKALEAKRMIEANPNLSGYGKAQAALIIGIVGISLWVVGVVIRISQIGR